MADLVLSEDPEVGAGAAAIYAASPPLVKAKIDATARAAQPTQNYSDAAKLRVRGAGADQSQAFVFFAIPFPDDAYVTSATVHVYAATAFTGAEVLTAERIVETWKENRLTWDKRPAIDATNAGVEAVAAIAAGTRIDIDVTDLYRDVAAGDPYHGLRLKLDDDVDRRLWSSENPKHELRPVLEIAWAEAPLAPTELAPGGGRYFSLDRPNLSWRYKDPEQEAQTSSRVQVASDEAFTSILYDSGKVANTDTQWDLDVHAPGPFAIGDGDVVYWRVMVWNEADLPSEWSDTEQIVRATKGALTIVNPPPEPDNIVEETTPPIDWTFTGRDQLRATVELFELSADELLLPYTQITRWRVDVDTSVTVPKNEIRSGRTYRAIVRVWDDFDRQATAGDPAFVEASIDFTYERSGVPAAVETLNADPVRNTPEVRLQWTRTLEPDYFCHRVDGVEVDARIDPEDVLVAPGVYAMSWSRGESGRAYEHEIEAVVNNAGKLKHSDGNPTAIAQTRVGGVWLIDDDPADYLAVRLADRQESQFEIGETGTTYDLPGSRKPVRLIESIRGYEGTIAGVLLSPEDKDTFLELKGRTKVVRLVQSTLNVPVFIAEVGVSPRPAPGGRYNATAQVFQVGEWPMHVAGD